MNPKARTKARLAVVLLTLSAGCLGAVLLTCLPPRAQRPSTVLPASRPERPQRTGSLAIIIDDAGYNLEDLQPFLDFPGPIAIAVLPHLPHSSEAARRIREAGKELLLHMPMEPLNGEDPGPGALLVGQSDEEVERLLASAFASVPGAVGMNNHMGSRASADETLMGAVVRYLKREGKCFVDSRTTADSLGARLASRTGVPFLQRDVFIDNERDEPDLEKSIAQGVAEALAKGQAVLIGHVHSPQILAIVRNQVAAGQDGGVRLATLEELLGGSREGHQ
jgi:polysaccharide deacetylase 2 family uncharacterized protein YibQ